MIFVFFLVLSPKKKLYDFTMKRVYLLIFFLLISPLFILGCFLPAKNLNITNISKDNNIKMLASSNTRYGLIGEGAELLDQHFNVITGLPSTYFVIILSELGDYYLVEYSDLSGYVLKTKISPIDYEPKIKFGSAYFTAKNDTHPVNIRQSPYSSAPIIASIPDGESVFYYGAVSGEALIPSAGNTWYYVRYNDGVNKYGYVYSVQGQAQEFAVNPGDRVEPPAKLDDKKDKTSLSDWVFILLLCIPAVIIMLALFARPQQPAQNT